MSRSLDSYYNEYKEVKYNIDLKSNEITQLKKHKKDLEEYLNHVLKECKLESYKEYKLVEVIVKPRKPRKTKKEKETIALDFFKRAGIADGENFYKAFLKSQEKEMAANRAAALKNK